MKQDKEWEYENKVNELNMKVQHMIADFQSIDDVLTQLEDIVKGSAGDAITGLRKNIQRYVQ